MAERQTGHRKSCFVLSARFPVVNWHSSPVAKSSYIGQGSTYSKNMHLIAPRFRTRQDVTGLESSLSREKQEEKRRESNCWICQQILDCIQRCWVAKKGLSSGFWIENGTWRTCCRRNEIHGKGKKVSSLWEHTNWKVWGKKNKNSLLLEERAQLPTLPTLQLGR